MVLQRNPLVPQPPRRCSITAHIPPPLQRAAHPAHVQRRDPDYVAAATQLICPSIALVIISRRCLDLPGCLSGAYLPCHPLHRRALPCQVDRKELTTPEIFSAHHNVRGRIEQGVTV
jgi:hypothetical protein